MSLSWSWLRITNKASARRAIKGGFWACVFIAVVDTAFATYSLSTRQKMAGYYDAWVFVDGALFAIIAWRLWKNSRTWAVIGVLLEGFEIVDKLQHAVSTFSVVTVLLFLAIINAARGTYALHSYVEQEAVLLKAGQGTAKPLGEV
jgi:hypothetical protein